MLKPKLKIGIIYGHNHKALRSAESVIKNFMNEGYRVECKVLRLRKRVEHVLEEFKKKFKDISAAIIFMTPDDFAICKKDLKKISESITLVPRARQNVVLELGYVENMIGTNNMKIFADYKSTEIPSDLTGKDKNFITDLSDKSIGDTITFLIKENLKLSPQYVLDDNNYHITYYNLLDDVYGNKIPINKNILEFFDEEYKYFDDDREKIVYLFERVVFNSYIQNMDWWKTKLDTINPYNDKVIFCKQILDCVVSYMAAWKSHVRPELSEIKDIALKLESLLENIDNHRPLNPIIEIVAYDYLALSLNKLGTNNNIVDVNILSRAENALDNVIKLARKFDDPNKKKGNSIQLWEGYATYNLGRVLNRINPKDTRWKEKMEIAINIREKWSDFDYFSYLIREGLRTEYLHAKAEYLLLNDEVDKNYYEEARNEYNDWQTKNDRVLLAKNVNDKWRDIKPKFKFIEEAAAVSEQDKK